MKALDGLARKHPGFTAQLVAVIRGKKPVVGVDFELHGQEYAEFIDLLISHQLVWFEHSPYPVSLCYPTSLHGDIAKRVKIYEESPRDGLENYRFLRLSAETDEYKAFWEALSKGELPPLLLFGGELDKSFETIIARDFHGLKEFLTQYAVALKQKESFHKILGRAFGYPECCAERWNQDKEGKEDYIFWESVVSKGLEKAVPLEMTAVGHVPCDALCEPSRRLGKDYLEPLRDLSLKLLNIVIERLSRPLLFIDRHHKFPAKEVEPATVKDSLAVTEKEFLDRVKREMDEKPDIVLGRIETVPFLYLSDYVGLWWIAVDPGKTVMMCNATTGKIKVHKRVERTNIADLRVYKFRL